MRAIYFNELTKWPGIAGAGMVLAVKDGPKPDAAPALFCDSIFLYGDEFVVDGRFFVPKASSRLITYQYA